MSDFPLDTWRSLFEYNWVSEKPSLGFVAIHAGAIVGFIATIYSYRRKNGKSYVVCNLSSWYVRPQHRSCSLLLLAAAVQDRTVTYVALTPAPVTAKALRALGFELLNDQRIFFPPLSNLDTLTARAAPMITFEPERIAQHLDNEQLQIYRDHLIPGYLHGLVVDGGQSCYFIVKRRQRAHHPRVPYSEILYSSRPGVLKKHLERVKLALLLKQKTLGLSVYKDSFSPAPLPGHWDQRRGIVSLPNFRAP